ncbi:bifunctional helix-turn-helix transcriptional regulator/GNAT family N-acetyltransferase [Nonomuraea rhizosphaerae]|uniref:bifunctional helix-turn-helix transcriptional regulator/GNAT family N-acetyltransferase n=1 Tax=Nonomuraea rhizosphaerae TaxID=2665663 RepID=UPI001C5F3045|nr:helix-turn-helix domain-containing GNAT family N-acetyltransferase [Nonomuraea rhizosphaerae]
MNSLTAARVSEIRAFNRFYTKVIGVLTAGMLDTPYSLTEGRVLYELANAGQLETAELRTMLGLDAGYLSRILARFEGDGLITRERSATDARKQVVRLSVAGKDAFGMLDQRSADEAERLLGTLSEEGQQRLVAGMTTIRELLDGSGGQRSYLLRPVRAGDLSWVVHRHGVLYAQEYGWGMDFERLVARIVSDFEPSRDTAWIAEVDGRPAGCVFCVREDDTTARLRLLLVEPSARGMGIGARLVGECLRHAKAQGYERITLMTRDVLVSARRIYEGAGFELESEHRSTENGIEINEQDWSRAL